MQFVLATSCSPLKEIFQTSKYYEDEFWSSVKESNEDMKHGLDLAHKKVLHWSLKDFRAHYATFVNKNYPVWSAYDYKRFDEHYIPRAESFKLLYQLLRHQFNNDFDLAEDQEDDCETVKYNVYANVRTLIELLDKKSGKKNTIYICSEPNAGKTFFCDMIADYFLCPGTMKHWNRNNAFPIEELVCSRVAFWNEPSYELGVEDELLKLLGGDRISVNAKYKSAKQIGTVPVIITSNKMKFPTTSAFRERVIYWNWRTSPFLQYVGNKRLHPMAFEDLISAVENYFEVMYA